MFIIVIQYCLFNLQEYQFILIPSLLANKKAKSTFTRQLPCLNRPLFQLTGDLPIAQQSYPITQLI